ncbi:hypothetical protein [Lysinibacillus fusiformis]|uniref:hypothetical protein n=1 Tax=Lysinibacillus fusiformis TaxID=28031 RepID=UPI003AAA8BD2
MTKNFKRKMMAVPFAAMTSMMLMTSAFAAEATPVKQVEPIVEVAPAKTTTNLKLESNNDTERRQALEETFNVKLSDTMIGHTWLVSLRTICMEISVSIHLIKHLNH